MPLDAEQRATSNLKSGHTFCGVVSVYVAMDHWIVKKDGKEIAVPEISTIRRWAAAGYLKDGDLIFGPTTKEWVRLDQLPEMSAGNQPTDLLIRQGGHEYRAASLDVLREWVREGRILPESTVFDAQTERWMYVRTLPGIAVPSPAAPLRVVEVAKNYRHLVAWLGIQILFSIWYALADSLAILVGPMLLVTVFALAYYAYETARALGSTSALLWAAAMLIPCVNLLTLLMLSSRANEVCRANGIRVGLFGPEL